MITNPTTLYAAGFAAKCDTLREADQEVVTAPGVAGLLPTTESGQFRVVVTDDRAYDVLAAALGRAKYGNVTVFESAHRCHALLAASTGWRDSAMTAMAHADIATVPSPPLPTELRLRPVRRTPDDDPDGVPLEVATAFVAAMADSGAGRPESLADHLRGLPAPTRLWAATDASGAVRATSGCSRFGDVAHVLFVNTDTAWRGRGIGAAMTATALHTARAEGARTAYLDASAAGHGLYARLGFATAARVTRFTRIDRTVN